MRWSSRASIVALLVSIPLVLQAQSSPVTAVEKVADGIWMAQTDKGSNAGWFLIGDEVVAVDAGSDPATGKALLEKIQETAGKPVSYLVVTHAHGDHAGGVAPFVAAGAQVLCQENAAAAVASLVQGHAKAGLLALSDRLAFVGGPRRAGIYFLGPGHSNGDLFVFLPDDKVLFSGDLALAGRAPYMQSSDVDAKGWENILGRLAQLDVDKIVPGHGKRGTRQALAETYAYVKKVNELARMMLAERVPEDLVEARLRRPNSGIEPTAITPELVANVRGVMRADTAKAATPTAPPAKPAPTAKPSPKAPAKKG
jgi:cyclase